MLSEAMKKKRLQFCKKYKDWTSDQWQKVMFSDGSTFRLIRSSSKIIHGPSGVSRYDPQYAMKTVKHPESIMVLGAFSGYKGRGGLYFLPKNITMKGSNYMYIKVLRDHMLTFWNIHKCDLFYS
ncbi:hypothetical protein OTU49_015529 [Cherax quadricarinatus]|uniref:Uncharacterized protein n=1 Tax=Cherax quadricarinatus TaxID=27406 RepID=A0AAW0YD95_CHEQU